MVVLEKSKENFILDLPLVEEVEAKLREEERRKTGRYLAVSVVLFIVGLGLYQAISHGSTKMSALLSAAMIMFLYLLWMLYASQRRKHQLKISELTVDKEVSQVLESINNLKTLQPSSGPHDNLVYSSSEEETERYRQKVKEKYKTQNKENTNTRLNLLNSDTLQKVTCTNEGSPERKFSSGREMFIRTYSIA